MQRKESEEGFAIDTARKLVSCLADRLVGSGKLSSVVADWGKEKGLVAAVKGSLLWRN